MYHCISDRYDPGSGHYDSIDDFLAMCQAVFGEAPELRQEGECYRDDQGIVLEPAPEMAERFLRSETEAAAEETPLTLARLHDHDTGEDIRRATDAEEQASVRAAETDGGAGIIKVDGRRCYVVS